MCLLLLLLLLLCVLHADAFKRLFKSATTTTSITTPGNFCCLQNVSFHFVFLLFCFTPQLVLTLFKQHLLLSLLLDIFLNAVACRIIFISLEKEISSQTIGDVWLTDMLYIFKWLARIFNIKFEWFQRIFYGF